MPQMIRQLTPAEVRYKYLWVSELRGSLPEPRQRIRIIDADGQTFDASMHASQPRIAVPIELYRKHNPQNGQAVSIEIKPGQENTVNVAFESTPAENIESFSIPPEEPPSTETFFITASLESMLEDFIANNLSALEPGLRLFKDEDGVLGRQYQTEAGIIDLLCEDHNNNLVVIELKRGRESDRVIGQISRYIGWVKVKLAGNSRDVRGIVVLHRPTDKYPKDVRLEYAILANLKIELRYYEISLKFLEPQELL